MVTDSSNSSGAISTSTGSEFGSEGMSHFSDQQSKTRLAESQEDTASTEEKMAIFQGLVKALLHAPASKKRSLRNWVVDDLAVGRRLSERIRFVLDEAISTPRAGRLDDAIDVLDDARVNLTNFLRERQFHISRENMDEDAIYILVRAAGRRGPDTTRFIVPWAIQSDRIAVREAAVEALGDLDTPSAISYLHQIAKNDDSASVRDTARHVLNDLDEV